MWESAQRSSKNLWATLKSRLTTKPTTVSVLQTAFTRRSRNEVNVDTTPPIRIQVSPSDDTRDESSEEQQGLNQMSTPFTNHLEFMYNLGFSPVSLQNHSNISRTLHKVAFCCTGAVSVLQGIFDVKYNALHIAKSGTIRDVADLCYIVARVVLRGTIVVILAKAPTELCKLAKSVDSLAQSIMQDVGRQKVKMIGGAIIAACFISPMSYYAMLYNSDGFEFLEYQTQYALYDVTTWSLAGKKRAQEAFRTITTTEVYIGGISYVLCNSVAYLHELLASSIMMASTITLDYMADSLRLECKSPCPLPAEESHVGIIPQKTWEKYSNIKKASTNINKKYGWFFNLLHLLFLLQCIYFFHTFLKKPSDANVPRDLMELCLAGVMYLKMGSIAEVTDEFRGWIRENFAPCTHLKVSGTPNRGMTMTVLLDELRSTNIGISGGAGVVTKAFILVCISLAVEYFITLWTEDKQDCACPRCPEAMPHFNATTFS